jgi:site-specific recombinase XerD
MRLNEWVEQWLPRRHDLRATTWARLETTMQKQVLPRFGQAPLRAITNGGLRRWVSDLLASGLSAATTRKAVFALRQCLDAAIADNRLQFNPAMQCLFRRSAKSLRVIYRRARLSAWSTKCPLSIARWCWSVPTPAFGGEKPVPVARSVMRRLELHLSEFVEPTSKALVFAGGPLFRSCGRTVLRPAVLRAGLDEITFHGFRHSFVAIMVAAGCNVREVSEWAGHNSVAFTLTRYGGLFEDNADAAIDRLDALLGASATTANI